MFHICIVCACFYKSANIFQSQVASKKEVQTSIVDLKYRYINQTTLQRREFAKKFSDDVVLDAYCKTKQGSIKCKNFDTTLDEWLDDFSKFEFNLLLAQICVTFCQSLYALGISVGIFIVFRISLDYVQIG
tara:strand:- start:14 stop:406 length:393 start_codon:yes stop_codon:yes gene_type:complete